MTFSEDKHCPIMEVARILATLTAKQYLQVFSQCMRERCEWYGNGCPAYPTQLEIDIYKADKEFYEELEGRDAKSD